MSLVVGVDPSSKKIAIVWHDTLTLTSGAVSYTITKASEKMSSVALGRAQDHMDAFALLASSLPEERYAWVEDPLVGRGGVRATVVQAYVGGIIRASLVNCGFQVYDVNQSTWKKDVCGNGGAQKDDVARTVRIQWPKIEPVIGGDGDLTDAAAICLYGKSILGKVPALSARGDA